MDWGCFSWEADERGDSEENEQEEGCCCGRMMEGSVREGRQLVLRGRRRIVGGGTLSERSFGERRERQFEGDGVVITLLSVRL